MRINNSKFASIVLAVFLLTALVFTGLFSYHYGRQWLDSDHASEMILGKLLAKENVLLSSSWYYSTEIRLVYQTIFTMPLFKLLGSLENWALIRSLNIVLNNVVLILSYIFLMKQMKISIKWILISCFFLLIPLSYEYWNIVTFGGYYIFFIAQLFCCAGLFIKLAADQGTTKVALFPFVVFELLSFLLGVQGIRALYVVFIPLLVTSMYMWQREEPKRKLPLFIGSCGFIGYCAGFAVNCLLHYTYSFSSFENVLIEHPGNFLQKLGLCFMQIAGFFGLSPGSPLLSVRGLFSLTSIIGAFVLLWALFRYFRHIQLKNGQRILPLFFAASLLCNIFVFVAGDRNITSRFFLPFMVLYIPLLAIFFEYAEKNYMYLKRTAAVAGIMLFILGQGFLNYQSLAVRDTNKTRKGYIQYLLDNQLDFGFASFWNANVTTELSNGRIEIAGLETVRNTPLRIQKLLIPAQFFDPLYHSGETFLLLARSEWDMLRRGRSFSGLIPDYEDDNFIIIRYASTEIFYREVLGR